MAVSTVNIGNIMKGTMIMGYEYQEKFVDKANEILANQMKTKPEWIDRKALIKALESDFDTDWDDYASKNNFGKDYIDGVRDEYDDVLTIICKLRNLTDEETEIYNSRIEAEATDVQHEKISKWCPPLMGQGKCDTYCERCHGKIMRNSTGIFEETPYCPHCGADMRGEQND